jgi:ABC-type Fe3+ transport system permease subunit
MAEYPQRIGNSWSERRRLIRFRRKREKEFHLWQEFKLVPRWVIWMVVVLFLIAEGLAMAINLTKSTENGQIFPFPDNPVTSSFALAGIVAGCAAFCAVFIFLTAYVNRDAKRRGMNSALWTFLVIVLWPAYFAIGFIVYFLMRQPLPFNCPQCGTSVGARYNFCPNCKYNLHPSCPQCKAEVVESDNYCPYCSQDLRGTVTKGTVPPSGELQPGS